MTETLLCEGRLVFKVLLLDMDGVIVDFNQGVLDKYGIGQMSNPTEWEYEYEKDFGVSAKEFWNSLTDDFWRNLPPTKEMKDIMQLFKDRDLMERVCIMSKPPGITGFKGKAQWIKDHLPQLYYGKQFMLGFNKDWMARPDVLLIDDNMEFCRSFQNSGGKAFLFPRPWNICRDLEPVAVQELEDFMYALDLRGPKRWKK